VAGVGDVFLGDDGFGVEVVRRLLTRPPTDGVEVVDIGVRGVHLAYDLLDGCDLLVLVDAAPRGEPPGTVSLVDLGPVPRPRVPAEPDAADAADGADHTVLMNAHGMQPDAVLTLVETLGGTVGRAVLVACEPADLTDLADLSPPVEAAVDPAVDLVERLVADPHSILSGPRPRRTGSEGVRMLGKLIKVTALATMVAAVVAGYPDIKRYLVMRRM
jgi:hydrogenase maturation protease